MCYDAQSATLAKLKYARHRGDEKWAEELMRKLNALDPVKYPLYHVNGYAHPPLLVFTNDAPLEPQAFVWGLIPYWMKTAEDAKKIWNQTLNAKGETIFEKPSFRVPAKQKRCLIFLDGFYEYHHVGNKTVPYRIFRKDGEPLTVAGLWDEWTDTATGEIVKTVTIVTTVGNGMMAQIHNNPKADMGPRMPVLLKKEEHDQWLMACKTDADKAHLQSLIRPFPDGELAAHPVGRLRGKEAVGNTPGALLPVSYGADEVDLSAWM